MELNKNRFNKGTDYGRALLKRSIQQLGCGRSALCDKNGIIIAGNNVYEQSVELGKKIVVIETVGDVLVVVKRTDIDANDKLGLELALVDNLTQDRNLQWDADTIHNVMQERFSFDPRKWGCHECLVKELDLKDLFRDNVQIKEPSDDKEANQQSDTQLSLFE